MKLLFLPETLLQEDGTLCNRQLLSISSNPALFSIIGTTYGGDGVATFALPDLRGRAVLHAGQGPGLSPRSLGQEIGTEEASLTIQEMPGHSHSAASLPTTINISTDIGTIGNPDSQYLANHTGAYNEDATAGATLGGVTSSTTIGNTGGDQDHPNVQPSLAVNYIIALQGVFPSRD